MLLQSVAIRLLSSLDYTFLIKSNKIINIIMIVSFIELNCNMCVGHFKLPWGGPYKKLLLVHVILTYNTHKLNCSINHIVHSCHKMRVLW